MKLNMKEIIRILAKKQLMEMKEDDMEDEMEDKEEEADMEEEDDKEEKGKMNPKHMKRKKAMILMMLKSKMK